jgi:undecaprenyl-diphosphatase
MLYLYLIIFAQTVLESFPISSSGHVALITVLCQKYFGPLFLEYGLNQSIFESWFYCLHAITALVLAIFFFPQWSFFIKNISRVWRMVARLVFLVGVTDVITCACYVIVRHYELSIPLSLGFCITGIMLASLKFLRPSCISNNSKLACRSFGVSDALILGAVQGVALMPGISRLATTFVVARWLGYSSQRAFELTWMIQWPLIFAASLLGFYQLHESHALTDFLSSSFIFVYLIAGVGAYVALYALQWCVDKDKVWWFAYYMIVPIVLAFGVVIF